MRKRTILKLKKAFAIAFLIASGLYFSYEFWNQLLFGIG